MTVHVSRLLPVLEKAGLGFRCVRFREATPRFPYERAVAPSFLGRISWLYELFLGSTEDLHYVFSGRAEVRFIAALLSRFKGKKVVLRIGGESLEDAGFRSGTIKKQLTMFALRNVDAIVGVSEDICNSAIKLGAPAERVHHIPGFIPPVDDGRSAPGEVVEFWSQRSARLLAIACAESSRSREIYGFHALARMIQRLEKNLGDVGCVFVVYGQNSKAEAEELRTMTKEMGLDNQLLVIRNDGALWPLFRYADIFLRPTSTDGDANSIREALAFGVPVIASDCVTRPHNVITFETHNDNDFLNVVEKSLYDLESITDAVGANAQSDNSTKLVGLFADLLAGG